MWRLILTLGVLLLDQWTKWLVIKKMELYESIPIVDSFLFITSHRNRGAAFGILQEYQWLFIGITVLMIVILIYSLWYPTDERLCSWTSLSFSLILGGALGNLVDRLRMGEVVDFLDVRFGAYHYPIFNIADSAVVVGVILWLISYMLLPRKEE